MRNALQKICCDIVLSSLANDALTVGETAVAFENAGQPIDLFPHTLRTAKQTIWFAPMPPVGSRRPQGADDNWQQWANHLDRTKGAYGV